MTIQETLASKKSEILAAAAKFGAGHIRIFGSVARNEAGGESDVDILVDFEDGRSLMDHAGLVLELESIFGRKVDVVTAAGLKPRIRERVLKEAVPL
jgi:uncharacterized protein